MNDTSRKLSNAMTLVVEDIMCDQSIIATEMINVEHNSDKTLVIPSSKIWIPNVQNVIFVLKNKLLPALATFLANSLSRPFAPLQRLPLSLTSDVVRVRYRRRPKSVLAKSHDTKSRDSGANVNEMDERPEKCVDCVVLYEPEEEPHADIIFIHGLHGGLDRTWAQGQWRQKNPKLKSLKTIRRHSSGDLCVHINDEVQPGRLKRTINRIYTIPPKLVRKSSNQNENEEEFGNKSLIKELDEVNSDKNDYEEFSRCWPRDWLPQDCPGVRVLGINYTTDVLWRPLWQKMRSRTDLLQRSEEMIEELLRLGVGKRPIVWVGHSKGGLYIKQILLNAWNANPDDQMNKIHQLTKAIMFYSVPHKGSPIADMVFPFFRRSIEVLEVQTNCDIVLNLHRRFLEFYNQDFNNKPEIFSFIDTENTPVGFTSLKFIAYESADPNIGTKCVVPLNHREICKPAGRDCILYLELVKLIKRTIFNEDI